MLQFKKLWSNHPTIKGDAPLLDKSAYENQCAVNMHACLERSGTDMKTFHGARSWEKGKPRYALRAQELADWLTTPFSHLPFPVQKLSGKEVFEKISGKTGILFLQNYWGSGHQGDHIDLFNGSRLTDLTSWARIHLGISVEGIWSDYRKSQSALFWQVL
jgi:hypothetical protein